MPILSWVGRGRIPGKLANIAVHPSAGGRPEVVRKVSLARRG